MPKVKYKSFNDRFLEKFGLVCKNCGSTNVVIDYEEAGGYSEYTQWGSSFSCRCTDCEHQMTGWDNPYSK